MIYSLTLYELLYTMACESSRESNKNLQESLNSLYCPYQEMGRWLYVPTLQKLRELAVLTQAELAEKVGVSVTTISHWETGSKRPRASNIRKLAEVFSVTPREVLAAINESPSTQE